MKFENQRDANPAAEVSVCSVISKRSLAKARVLAESLRAYQPQIPYHVLLVDHVDGCFRPDNEPFQLVTLDELGLPGQLGYCFQYTPLELCCFCKPYFMSYLFRRQFASKLIYLDADILLLHALDEIPRLLDRYSILLTPHLDRPYDDDKQPDEESILRAGVHNAGFLGLAHCDETQRFLDWWCSRLRTGCVVDLPRGLFADQKWLDLVPGLFQNAHVLRDPGYNVAYWNLHSRTLTIQAGQICVNGGPCYFFHFSGFDPDEQDQLSRHQNRHCLGNLPVVKLLCDYYRARLASFNDRLAAQWPYSYARFDNGAAIPNFVRRLYLQRGFCPATHDNPFATAVDNSYFAWLTQMSGGSLSPLLLSLHAGRLDLQIQFPQPAGRDRQALLQWFVEHGKREYDLDEALLGDARRRLIAPRQAA
ncbi:MAG: hypothetical protein AB7K24_23540 [Gemmataceae bacterium]